MKIAVIGAGIIGVTTAYELACDGHEVTVMERRAAAAEETSFANAGIVAPGYVTPWAAPGMPSKVIQHLFSRYAPVKVGLPLSLRELAWMWRWYRACQPETYLANRAQLQSLALYSRDRLHHITADLKLEYDRSDGYMVLLRSEKDSKLAQPGLQLLRDAGLTFKELSPVEARKAESALNPDTSFFSAIYLPDDEVGNCRQFALMLKNEALRMGVKFAFNTTVTQINTSAGATVSIAGEQVPRPFDAVVMCAGLDSTRLLGPLGLKIPMVAVHGYSLSAPIREPLNAPRSAVMDEHYKVAISRLGNRVRVAGGAEIGGASDKKRASSVATLYKVLHDWFPGAANLASGVQQWKGARPMLPDGPPILGASGLSGLWLNLGHGSSGWALSCGSARVLADLIGGRTPGMDVAGLGVDRLRA
ncbi:D-amino acid dehydrogenase [Rhodoferax sp.]|uniref:D-amino acid dehydrogenase n=1 Tax=Rhodoferax sp. TaxID=50421 RepID=UPI001ED2C99A|nr:D-amino acid dehydrogenase [Rhodoferax sp.]MBT9506500.1 D-amino acid dehydrogenase [Rhodoferax sp.]